MFDERLELIILLLLGISLLVYIFASFCVGCEMREKLLRATQNIENPETEIRLLDLHQNELQEAKEEHEKCMAEERRNHRTELENKTAEVREIHENEMKEAERVGKVHKKDMQEAQRRHNQELEDIKTKHKTDIKQALKKANQIQKLENEKEAKAAIVEKFSAVKVSRKGVAHAENVMKDLTAFHWREGMTTSVDSGIKVEDLEKFGKNLVENLNITDDEHKRKLLICLDKVTYSTTAKSTLNEVKCDLDQFTSLYGFLGSFTADDGIVTIAYAFHTLTFNINPLEAEGFTIDTLTAIKDTYARHMALKTLRDEGFIPKIIYCD